MRGTVTDPDGNPIAGINVNVNGNNGGPSTGTSTAADGTYAAPPLPYGEYRVQFFDQTQTWGTQFWNGQPSWNTATMLTLTSEDGSSRDGVDAHLTRRVERVRHRDRASG